MFRTRLVTAAASAAMLAAVIPVLCAAPAQALPGIDLTCTASWTTQFSPGLQLTGTQPGTITISGGTATTCLDTSGQSPAVSSGTFTGTGSYLGSCTGGTASLTITFSWTLANGGIATSTATATATNLTLASLTQLTVASGRLAGDTITVANLRTQENITNCATPAGLTQVSATGAMIFSHT